MFRGKIARLKAPQANWGAPVADEGGAKGGARQGASGRKGGARGGWRGATEQPERERPSDRKERARSSARRESDRAAPPPSRFVAPILRAPNGRSSATNGAHLKAPRRNRGASVADEGGAKGGARQGASGRKERGLGTSKCGNIRKHPGGWLSNTVANAYCAADFRRTKTGLVRMETSGHYPASHDRWRPWRPSVDQNRMGGMHVRSTPAGEIGSVVPGGLRAGQGRSRASRMRSARTSGCCWLPKRRHRSGRHALAGDRCFPAPTRIPPLQPAFPRSNPTENGSLFARRLVRPQVVRPPPRRSHCSDHRRERKWSMQQAVLATVIGEYFDAS